MKGFICSAAIDDGTDITACLLGVSDLESWKGDKNDLVCEIAFEDGKKIVFTKPELLAFLQSIEIIGNRYLQKQKIEINRKAFEQFQKDYE